MNALRIGAWTGLFLSVTSFQTASGQDDRRSLPPDAPTMREVLSVESLSSPRISPSGTMVAYTVRRADWRMNRFDREIWLQRIGDEPFQLTRTTDKDSSSPRWSPDGEWIGFLADRGKEPQVFFISSSGGESRAMTRQKGGVTGFRWSPDGKQIAYSAKDPESEELARREKAYGGLAIEDQDFRLTHLWICSTRGKSPEAATRLTTGDEFTVGSFEWSPDGRRIAFDHRPTPQIDAFVDADISVVEVESREVFPLVTQVGPDTSPRWSPDGNELAFVSTVGANPYYGNRVIASIKTDGGKITSLSDDFDESASPITWRPEGIWFLASQKTERGVFLLDPKTRKIEPRSSDPRVVGSMDLSADGKTVVLVGESDVALPELYVTDPSFAKMKKITRQTEQVSSWPLGTREVVRWQSRDGVQIEGVLWKPKGHDPKTRAPLFTIIHGGPTGTSRPGLLRSSVYPIAQWLAKGALILMPNYRGSAGYGAAFRALNVRNLGVDDAWDVLSGVDHLVESGLADPDRLGAMGWSQGGYISAFLSTTTKRFKAISNGAGISNWVTYYVNTDIHGFTRNYLEATPWDDPEIYRKTSPMSYILEACTPTLIQHGEFDRRVPVPNAFELYQGLRDQNVETRLILYKGFGHGITKPKERLAATWHNWQWFEKYLFGNEVEIPLPEADEEKSEGK